MKPEHEIFIRQMAAHGDKYRAYKEAYPDADGESLRKAAERLARRADIAQMLSVIEDTAREKIIKEAAEMAEERTRAEMASIEERRALLARMMRGQHKVKRCVKLGNAVQEIEEDINPFAIIRAIELDTKLEALYNAKLAKAKADEEPALPEFVVDILSQLRDPDHSKRAQNLPPNHPLKNGTHSTLPKDFGDFAEDVYTSEAIIAHTEGYKTGYADALGIPKGVNIGQWQGGKYAYRLPPWYDKSKDPIEEHPVHRSTQIHGKGPLIMPYEEQEVEEERRQWQLAQLQKTPVRRPSPPAGWEQNGNNLR